MTKTYGEQTISRLLMNLLNRASMKPKNSGLISLIETLDEAGVQSSDTGFVLTMGNGEAFEITITKFQ